MLGDSLGYTDGKVLGSDEGFKMGSTDGKVLGIILRDVDEITWDLLMVTAGRFRDAYVAARAECRAIGACIIRRVTVVDVTAAT